MQIVIKKSDKSSKKYVAIIDGQKHVYFGDSSYEDFTIHKDEQRKQRYIQRHKANEAWNDYNTAGFWSKHLLWNLPTLRGSIADVNKRFNNLNVKLEM